MGVYQSFAFLCIVVASIVLSAEVIEADDWRSRWLKDNTGADSTLRCYTCNVSTSNLDNSACTGIASISPCASNSVCLSATYKATENSISTYTTVRTCFLKASGMECEIFLKAQKGLRNNNADLKMETCYQCETDVCNRYATEKGTGIRYESKLSVILYSIIFVGFVQILF